MQPDAPIVHLSTWNHTFYTHCNIPCDTTIPGHTIPCHVHYQAIVVLLQNIHSEVQPVIWLGRTTSVHTRLVCKPVYMISVLGFLSQNTQNSPDNCFPGGQCSQSSVPEADTSLETIKVETRKDSGPLKLVGEWFPQSCLQETWKKEGLGLKSETVPALLSSRM